MRRVALLLVAALALTSVAWRLDTIRDPAERRAVVRTLDLIERGGPFPYAKDGSIFGNFEGRLPRAPRGYYREYTVTTPRIHNRGARRIVRGARGDTWYTRDHYLTFVRIDG